MRQTKGGRHAFLEYYFSRSLRNPSPLHHRLDEQAFIITFADNHSGSGEQTTPMVARDLKANPSRTHIQILSSLQWRSYDTSTMEMNLRVKIHIIIAVNSNDSTGNPPDQ
jgi:hypothetical protein